MTEIRTERLLLRAARADERPALFRVFSNRQAMRYWDSPAHQSEEDTTRYHGFMSRKGPRRYFVWDLDGEIIGAGGIHSRAELGFILHPAFWGRGFAREACSAIIDHMWATTKLKRLVAEADPRNLASIGLLTRLGFQVTDYKKKTLFLYEEWCDSVFLALPRPAGG
jgi:RimJ/RimL family protein N-acetyltransferase